MGILDLFTGQKAREEAEARRLADERARKEAEQQAERDRETLQKDDQACDEALRQQALLQSRQQDGGPAERLFPDDEAKRQRVRAGYGREKSPEPEPAQVATRMELTPGLQRAPSMGGPGINFVNPRVRQPERAPPRDLLDEARQRLAQRTPEQVAQERETARQVREREDRARRERERSLDDDPRRG